MLFSGTKEPFDEERVSHEEDEYEGQSGEELMVRLFISFVSG